MNIVEMSTKVITIIWGEKKIILRPKHHQNVIHELIDKCVAEGSGCTADEIDVYMLHQRTGN